MNKISKLKLSDIFFIIWFKITLLTVGSFIKLLKSLLFEINFNNALLKLISNSKDFNNLIKDPTVSRVILNQIIKKISDNFNLEILFKNFLSFLITKRRFFYVRQILKNFNEICYEKRGELRAEIKSAKNLTQDEINKITQELSNNFKSEIKLNYTHDQSLIGGLVVHN